MIALLLLASQADSPQGHQLDEWPWRAALETPGGKLEFRLEFQRKGPGAWSAFVVNAQERIEVPSVTWDGHELVLGFPHYDSRIVARFEELHFEGTWEKRRSAEETARLAFEAQPWLSEGHLEAASTGFAGRWKVDFEGDEQPAVADLEELPENGLRGTFLTSTGDYRYLSGERKGRELTLSCFDGAHAFLFTARLMKNGTLKGGFYSGDWHFQTWRAERNDAAHIDDPFGQTRWNGRKVGELTFPDLEGKPRSLGDPLLAGKATLLVVFG